MFFLLFIFFILFIIFLLLLLLSAVWPPDSPWAPWWQMPIATTKTMCKMAHINSTSIVYDLGCGTGLALITAAKEFNAHGVGIEIDPLRVWIAKQNVKKFEVADKLIIVKKNFFDVDLSLATVVFMYLVPSALKRLTPKLAAELKPSTLLLSYHYELPVALYGGRMKLVEKDKKNEIFMYRLGL